MRAAILMAVLFVAVVLAARADLHHAVRHHSSLEDAAHVKAVRHTDNWLVRLKNSPTAQHLVDSINRQLSNGRATLHRILPTGVVVIAVNDDASHDELAVVLLSEQRGGIIDWFHRDGIKGRHSH